MFAKQSEGFARPISDLHWRSWTREKKVARHQTLCTNRQCSGLLNGRLYTMACTQKTPRVAQTNDNYINMHWPLNCNHSFQGARPNRDAGGV